MSDELDEGEYDPEFWCKNLRKVSLKDLEFRIGEVLEEIAQARAELDILRVLRTEIYKRDKNAKDVGNVVNEMARKLLEDGEVVVEAKKLIDPLEWLDRPYEPRNAAGQT